MLFAILCTDRPDSAALRATNRPAHLAYLQTHAAKLIEAGPLLDPEGTPRGSLLLVDLPDQAAAESFAAGDPYAHAGLFHNVAIRGFRSVFKDGRQV